MWRRLLRVVGPCLWLAAWPASAAPPKAPPPRGAPVGPAAAAPLVPAVTGVDLGTVKVGSWAEYVVVDLARKTTLRLKLAVVERGDAGTWFELSMQAPRLERLVIKSLIKGDPRAAGSVKRVILRVGNLQALEVVGGPPDEAAPRFGGALEGTPIKLGTEVVRVPAGAVTAEHVRIAAKKDATDLWLSAKVPLFGLVKLKSREAIYELTGSGADARTQISGRVGKLDLATLRALAPGAPAK